MFEYIPASVLSYTALSIVCFFIPIVMLCLTAKIILEHRTRRMMKLIGIAHAVLLVEFAAILVVISNETVMANVVFGYIVGCVLFLAVMLGAGVAWAIRFALVAAAGLSVRMRREKEIDYTAPDHSLI